MRTFPIYPVLLQFSVSRWRPRASYSTRAHIKKFTRTLIGDLPTNLPRRALPSDNRIILQPDSRNIALDCAGRALRKPRNESIYPTPATVARERYVYISILYSSAQVEKVPRGIVHSHWVINRCDGS